MHPSCFVYRCQRTSILALYLLAVIVVPTLMLLLLLGSLSGPVCQAAPGQWYVSLQGNDGNSCSTATAPCRRVQAALDKAGVGDIVNVAEGNYTDSAGTVALIAHDLTLQGGWNGSFSVRDPVAYPTVLDAQGRGPVVVILGPIGPHPVSPVIQGFVLTHGDGTGVVGCLATATGGCGGGIFGVNTTPSILDNVIVNNVATAHGEGFGGGIYLQGPFTASLIAGNTIVGNQATISSTDFISGWGGGISLYYISAVIYDNLIQDNVASASKGWGYGGGILLYRSAGQVISNVLADNIASTVSTNPRSGWGGGISVYSAGHGEVSIVDNEVRGNVASVAGYGSGGGVHMDNSNVLLRGNRVVGNMAGTSMNTGSGGGICGRYGALTILDNDILSNTATTTGTGYGGGCQLESGRVIFEQNLVAGNMATEGPSAGYGGGVNCLRCNDSIVRRNIIRDNVASLNGEGYGGGFSAIYGSVTLEGNHILDNQATGNDGLGSWGGGVYVDRANPVTLTNNVIAHNEAQAAGGGIYVAGRNSAAPASAILIHNTLAENAVAGSGEGIYLTRYATVSMTNNIVVSHSHGISCGPGPATATARYTLFHGNYVSDTGGTVTSTDAITGAPCFAAPAAGDFHIRRTSAALDRGVRTYVTNDVDRDVRPIGEWVDIGADEMGLRGVQLRLSQDPELTPAGTVVYRHLLTNTGDYSDTFSLGISSLWPAAYTPVVVTLAPSASRLIVVSVTLPLSLEVFVVHPSLDHIATHTAVLKATSALNVNVYDSVGDVIFYKPLEMYLPIVTRSIS